MTNNPTRVITGVDTRWSYANVWIPKSINGGTPKFSVSLIIPKSDKKTVDKIKAAIEAAYKDGESKLKGSGKSVPALSVLKIPLRDGDIERPDDEAYANSYFINVTALQLLVLWMLTASQLLIHQRFTVVCMVEQVSTSMLLTVMATKELPVA